MPLPGTHTARQADPGKYVKFRQKELTDDVVAIIGVTKDDKAEIQSVHFDAKRFTPAEAKKWLEDHDFSADDFEPAAPEKAKAAGVWTQAEAAALLQILAYSEDQPRDERGRFGSGGGGGGADKALEKSQAKEKASLDRTHAGERGKVETARAREDRGTQAQRGKEDKVVEKTRAREDKATQKGRDKEDAAVQKQRDKEDRAVQKKRDIEDSNLQKGREKDDKKSPPDIAKKDLRDTYDTYQKEARQKEDTAREQARAKEDGHREATRETADKATEAQRGKEDARTDRTREAEDKARETARDQHDQQIADKHAAERVALGDKHDTERQQAERASVATDTVSEDRDQLAHNLGMIDEAIARENEAGRDTTHMERVRDRISKELDRFNEAAQGDESRDKFMKMLKREGGRATRHAQQARRAAGEWSPDLEIAAAYEGGLHLCASGDLELQAAGTGDSPDKLRNFSMVAYTGSAMRLPGFSLPVVVDLAGMRVPSQRRPILRQHDPERIVGHSETVEVSPQRLKLTGVISGVHPAAGEVLALSDRGFPWAASIGAGVEKMDTVEAESKVTVNGRSFTGPLYVARATVLGEVSFVPVGADSAASAGVH